MFIKKKAGCLKILFLLCYSMFSTYQILKSLQQVLFQIPLNSEVSHDDVLKLDASAEVDEFSKFLNEFEVNDIYLSHRIMESWIAFR